VGQELRIPGSASAPRSVAPAKRAPKKLVSSRPLPGPIKQGSSYTVQKGDTLSSIAKRSGVTVAEIKTANSLSNDGLSAGKQLSIPKKGEAKAVAASKSAPAKESKPAASKSVASAAPAPVAAIPAPAPIMETAPAAPAVDPNLLPSVDASVAPAAPAAPAAAVVPAALPVATSASAPVYEHVLYPGETLEDVARQYGSSQQEIMKLNNITDPLAVKAGTKLLVPIPE
ncbi:MAG: LysM peptidoglycan-binding domain-containing protein, partial [Kiritimatiellaceae bacterium]|nr:LysM peptidoglycan-binding domain-containing protein [Kiritimatiellaceae bacterium]